MKNNDQNYNLSKNYFRVYKSHINTRNLIGRSQFDVNDEILSRAERTWGKCLKPGFALGEMCRHIFRIVGSLVKWVQTCPPGVLWCLYTFRIRSYSPNFEKYTQLSKIHQDVALIAAGMSNARRVCHKTY